MFIKHEGSKTITIGEEGCELTVHLPPEGMVYNWQKKKLESGDVICRSVIPEEQYWERQEPPDDWDDKRRLEKIAQQADPAYFDPDLEEYRSQEWRRRLFGCWFMNNGKMVYLTGTHYFFLTHWSLDIGFPDFRYPDLEFFYAWDYVAQDDNSAGLIMLTKRRQGKTAKSGVIMYERTSRTAKAMGGIQSKTEKDAKEVVFFNGIIQSFIYMIDFFVPKFDRGKVFPPTDNLRFFPTAMKGAKAMDFVIKKGDYLESSIGFRNSSEKAYDGTKLFTYIGDETAKSDRNINVNKRHYIVRKTLLGRDQYSILGKALYTTTVEEMNSNAEDFIDLWNESDQSKLSANKRTKSWLYRWFVPAHKTLFFDRYGYADEKKGVETLNNERESLKDRPHALASEIRQNPMSWREAFRSDGDTCLYNPLILDDRLEHLKWVKGAYERGSLMWEDRDKKDKVIFTKNPNGRFYVYQPPTDPNNVKFPRLDRPIPNNPLRYVIGVDPFDHDRTKNGAFSLGAAAVYKRYDSMDSSGDNFVCVYKGRPPHPYMFYEDMVMLSHWYGCWILFEDQKIGIKRYFEDNDRMDFMMRNDKGEVGISASAKAHIDIVEETTIFIEQNGHRVMFADLVNDWRNFNMDDTEEFDLGMASGYALIGNSRIRRVNEKRINKKTVGMGTLFPKFQIIKRR